MSKRQDKRKKQEKAWAREAAKRAAWSEKNSHHSAVVTLMNGVDEFKDVVGRDLLPSADLMGSEHLNLDMCDEVGWGIVRNWCEGSGDRNQDLLTLGRDDAIHAIANLCDEFWGKVQEFRQPYTIYVQGLPEAVVGYPIFLTYAKYGKVRKQTQGVVVCEDGSAFVQLFLDDSKPWSERELLTALLVELPYSLMRAAAAVHQEAA